MPPTMSEAIAVASAALAGLDRESNAPDMISDPGQLNRVGGFQSFGIEDPRSVAYGYWRKPNGWITFEQYRHNTLDRFMRRWSMLPQYGEFKLIGQPGWDPHRDPYAALVAKGGAGELPPDQVLALRWHRRPDRTERGARSRVWVLIDQYIQRGLEIQDAVEAVLPQLVGTDWREWRDYHCQFCPQRVFNTASDVARHESVMHREDVRSREIRDSISDALTKSGAQQAPLLEAVVAVLGQLAQEGKDQKTLVAELLAGLRQDAKQPPADDKPREARTKS